MSRTILVVEDDPIQREAYCRLFSSHYECVPADSAEQARGIVSARSMDVVLTDVMLPDDEGLEWLGHPALVESRTPVIVLTGSPTLETALRGLNLGVVDFLLKPVSSDDLMVAVARAMNWVDARERLMQTMGLVDEWRGALDAAETVLRRCYGRPAKREITPLQTLTKREREVVERLRAGMRVQAIASSMHLSPHTIRNHLKSIFRKLGVSSQVELLAMTGDGPPPTVGPPR